MAARREGVFVSYAREDERWALWIGNQMMTLGFDVELDKWSWRGGDDFVARMNATLAKADVVVSIWSKSYFQARTMVAKRGHRSFVSHQEHSKTPNPNCC
jgi:hypothetical protein